MCGDCSNWRLLFVLVCVHCADATILYVPDMFTEPQLALDASLSGDTVIMRGGTYSAPIVIPAHNLTVGSEYILIQNNAYIANCVIRPDSVNPNVRCFNTVPASGISVELNLIGMTLQEAYSIEGDGGGVRLINRTAKISDCVFKTCAGINGGAIFADTCVLDVSRTLISGCDALTKGRCLFARASKVRISDSHLSSSSAMMLNNGGNPEIMLTNSRLSITGSRIRNMGHSAEGMTTIIAFPDVSICDSVVLYNCTIENSRLTRFMSGGSQDRMHVFVLDSCRIVNNAIAFGFFVGGEADSLRQVSITKNRFENNSRPGSNYNGVGLITLTDPHYTAIVEENYFLFNDGGAYSCIQVRGDRDPETYRVQRNYFSGNSNFGFSAPPGGAVWTPNLGEGIVEYNVFADNIGHAFDTWEFGTVGYAMHNYWGDSTGPFVVEQHPEGLGDTTDEDTIYDEWLLSEDEIPDTSIFSNAVDERPSLPSTWRILSVFPNPFNNEFRLELAGFTNNDFEIRLYDLLGREVALLHQGHLKTYFVEVTAPPNLATGVYFLRASDKLQAVSRKVVLLK